MINTNFSAKGISFKLNTTKIFFFLGAYNLAFEFLSCTANEPSASINPANQGPNLLRKRFKLFLSFFSIVSAEGTKVVKVLFYYYQNLLLNLAYTVLLYFYMSWTISLSYRMVDISRVVSEDSTN